MTGSLFETTPVMPVGTHHGAGFVRRSGGCTLESIDTPAFPPSPQGAALRNLRVKTSTTLRAAARLLGIGVVDLSGLEMGFLQFADASAWQVAISVIEVDAREGGRLRWKLTDPGYTNPPRACTTTEDCPACPLFTCVRCKKGRPMCFGAADHYPDWCDECVDVYGYPGDEGSIP